MTAPVQSTVATGWSLHLPDVDLQASLGRPAGGWAGVAATDPDRAADLLGRKGLLYKEPATRLALCAVHTALGLPVGRRPVGPMCPTTAVVACSNLGNVETVAQVARLVADEGGKAVSVLAAPNASSNVVASTVARWFGFGGPNLMVCSGARAGLDGLWLAGLLLRARRADRVVLVGVEPGDATAAALHAAGHPARPLRAGAACVVLRAWRPESPASDGEALVHLSSDSGSRPRAARLTLGPGGIDPAERWGDCYGAHGVVALALALHLAADDGQGPVGVTDELDDYGERSSRSALVVVGGAAP